MGLSANTLFHFTEFEFLKGILKNGFYPRCSVEQVAFSDDVFPVAIPMISFCDIRFSQLHEHLTYYKQYGIGLTKTWGISKGINPVFYIEKGTYPHSLIKTMVKAYFKFVNFQGELALKLSQSEVQEFTDLLQTIAYYKVNMTMRWNKIDHQFSGEPINFYDEREWRYFPGITPSNYANYVALPFIPILKNEKYDSLIAIERQNSECESHPVKFANQDIRYIIVKNDGEISELIEYLRKENLFTESFDILVSKINTVERIIDDH